MGLFTGSAPPDIQSTQTTSSTTPDYYTNYLTGLSQAGQTALTKTPSEIVAPLSALQRGTIEAAPTALTRYQTPLDSALTAGQAGAGVDTADINKFYNPYEKAVTEDMATRSATNVQRNLLPALKAGFVGTGDLGSRRYAGALGQTLGDVNTALLQEQNKAKMAMYQSAIDAALKEAGIQTSAASALTGLGSTEQQAATAGLKTAMDLGGIEQAQKQAELSAPLTQATNVAALLKGYTVPTTQTQTYKGPGTVYQPSPLSQIAGLGTLLASGFNTGGTGWGQALLKALGTSADNTNPTNPFATVDWANASTNADANYGGDTSQPGHWEGGEWVVD